MKVKCITVPKGMNGLEEVSFTRLGRFVLLVGPNGGGKTRILDGVFEILTNRPSAVEVARLHRDLDLEHASLKQNEKNLEKSSGAERARIEERLKKLGRDIAQINETIGLFDSVKVEDGNDPHAKVIPVRYCLWGLKYRSAGDLPFHIIRGASEQIASEFGSSKLSEFALASIFQLALDAEMGRGVGEATSGAKNSLECLERLNKIVRRLLNTSIEWCHDNKCPLIFGKPLDSSGLSEGQRVILGISLTLALKRADLNNVVIFLDEPETHLHPEALMEVMDSLVQGLPSAQFWIATHSIHLIAHLGEEQMWSVANGKASYGGRDWSRGLCSIMGGEQQIESLRAFLGRPVQHAMLRFAAQCLCAPKIVDTAPGDPQTNQIYSHINAMMATRRDLRVLDWGAGEGRLLVELFCEIGEQLVSQVDYTAFDLPDAPSPVAENCRQRIEQIYGSGAACKRYICGESKLREKIDNGWFDLVVLCNVLHEISPTDWVRLLGPNGVIDRVLANDGFLLIVEDQQLPIGERAHDFGFLVLDNSELCALFGASIRAGEILTDCASTHPDRLKAHLVPKSLLRNVSSESRSRAIAQLRDRAKDKASEIARIANRDPNAARAYSFWTAQFFNASVAADGFN